MRAALVTLGVFLFSLATYWVVDRYLINSEVSEADLDVASQEFKLERIPKISLPNLNDKSVDIEKAFFGKIVIVNFWASWCAPCVKEIPSLLRLLNRFPNDLALLAISVDENKADLTGFLSHTPISGENTVVLWDQLSKAARLFGTNKLPESYIFDREGKFLKKVAGYKDWTEPYTSNYFEKLIRPAKD